MFAKLYESMDGNQILVKIDDEDDGPEVRFYFEPIDLGVCSVSIKYDDTEEGWDKAEAYFASITEQDAINVVEKAARPISKLTSSIDG